MAPSVEDRVADVMERDPPVAHLHETLDRALARVRTSGKRTLAIVDGDRIAAVVSAASLERRCENVDDPAGVHLRDHYRPPVPFCYVEDPVSAARSALTRAAAGGSPDGAVAVVDDQQRLVGIVDVASMGDEMPGGPVRQPETPTDRSHMESPRLTVYAPWAALKD